MKSNFGRFHTLRIHLSLAGVRIAWLRAILLRREMYCTVSFAFPHVYNLVMIHSDITHFMVPTSGQIPHQIKHACCMVGYEVSPLHFFKTAAVNRLPGFPRAKHRKDFTDSQHLPAENIWKVQTKLRRSPGAQPRFALRQCGSTE